MLIRFPDKVDLSPHTHTAKQHNQKLANSSFIKQSVFSRLRSTLRNDFQTHITSTELCPSWSQTEWKGPREKSLYRLPINGPNPDEKAAWVHGALPHNLDVDDPVIFSEWLQKNPTRLQVIFLGTQLGGIATLERSLPCMAIRSTSEVWLFDVGEDTQRQCMKHPLLRPKKISRIFLTSLNLDVCSGLPGMLCFIAASREQGKVMSDLPVHVYGPVGTASLVRTFMEVSDTFLEMPVLIHEFSPNLHSTKSVTLSRRAKLWKRKIPPDYLNPQGYVDTALDGVCLLDRKLAPLGRQNSLATSLDNRAGLRPFHLPPCNNEVVLEATDGGQIMWSMKMSDEFIIKVYAMDEEMTCVGYRVMEADRAGNLDVEKAVALGVEVGPDLGTLKRGGDVKNNKGETITSEMVMSPDRKGRIITILGKIPQLSRCKIPSLYADCLIMPSCRTHSHNELNQWTAKDAIDLASSSQVKNLTFSRVDSSNYQILESIGTCLESSAVSVHYAFDFYTQIIRAN